MNSKTEKMNEIGCVDLNFRTLIPKLEKIQSEHKFIEKLFRENFASKCKNSEIDTLIRSLSREIEILIRSKKEYI